jgi:hypothetical protein
MKGVWGNNFKGGLLAGILILVLAGLLMGAVHPDQPSLPVAVLDTSLDRAVPLSSSGRYQLVSWQAGGGYGAFVVDTATGITKIAYSSGKGPGGRAVNNIGKPFSQM